MADIVTGTIVRQTGNYIHAVAGAAITAGQAVYADTAAGNTIKPADSDAAASAVVLGIALTDAGIGELVVVQKDGVIDLGVALADGELYVLSSNAGGIAPVEDYLTGTTGTGKFRSLLGMGNSDGYLVLNIINATAALS